MKTLKYIAIAAVSLLTACAPLTDDFSMDSSVMDASELNLTVKPVEVNGQKGNVIVVENHSPILSKWTVGDRVSTRACDTLLVNTIGTHAVTFSGLVAEAGKTVEKTFSVDVDIISTIPQAIAQRLCIGQEGAPTAFSTTFDPSLITWTVEGNVVSVCNPNPVEGTEKVPLWVMLV